jgi:Flp pilus assembly protein TadD
MNPKPDTSSREFLTVAAAALLVIFCYMGALSGPFVFDDEPNIVANPFIRVSELDWSGLYAAAFKSPLPNRPVANASFALNYYFNGHNVVGYRLVNILIHVINGFLLFALARATFQTPALLINSAGAGRIAAWAALVWMVHPLHTQSVGYIVQRMTGLATLFYLLAMLCYVRARFLPAGGRRCTLLYAACGLAGLLALGSKEISATLPAFIYLYEWYFFQKLDGGWLRRSLPCLAGVCILSAAVGLIFIGSWDPLGRVLAQYSDGSISAFQRLLTQARVVCFYISLIFWPAPSRLNLDHDFPFSLSLLDPASTLPALLVLAGLLAVAVITARRNALVSYAILWFLGNLVIESSIIRLETVFEHRTYLPSVMPLAALTAWLFRILRRKWAAPALLSAIALLWAAWTWQRSQVWGDAVALWQDCVNKSPAKARPHNNLGSTYMRLGRLEDAIPHLKRAVEIAPRYADATYNLGYALLRTGDLGQGIELSLRLLELEPENHMALTNLGVAYVLQKKYAQAVQILKEAVRLKPDFGTAWNNLGVALKNLGDLEAAAAHFSEAIRINPNYAEAYNNLGLTLKEQRKFGQAADNFRHALAISPDYPAAKLNLEEIEAMLKQCQLDTAAD